MFRTKILIELKKTKGNDYKTIKSGVNYYPGIVIRED